MPVVVRPLARDLTVAGYHFPNQADKAEDKAWPWLQDPATSQSTLCQTCSTLNLTWLFSHFLAQYTITNNGNRAKLSDGICLGSYGAISNRKSCAFCMLLVHTLNAGADYDLIVEYDDWPNRDLYLLNYKFSGAGLNLNPDCGGENCAIRLGLSLKPAGEMGTILSLGGRNAMIQRLFKDKCTAPSYGGLPLATRTPDLIETVKTWSDPCLNGKNSTILTGAVAREEQISLRLIDTEKACVVGPLQGQPYFALSYTWGRIDPLVLVRENEHILTQEGALLDAGEKLPRTISDAILLCRLLQQRYLWVDSLCICQNTRDKHEQIQQMDRIYQEASLTIVAAAGSDGNAGLPGVSKTRDIRQQTIDIGDFQLTNVLPDVRLSVAQSFWDLRGWTFQESLLSIRKLIFTPDQVYLHCQHGECSEDTNADLHQDTSPTRLDDSMRLNFENVSNWTTYRTVVAKYCERELSFESDVLNAFAGIASYLSRAMFMNSPFIAGIPSCSLEVGLMWQPTGRLRRRRDPTNNAPFFPSWSWAAWDGPMEYADTTSLDNLFERAISRITWGHENSTMTLAPTTPPSLSQDDPWIRNTTTDTDEIYYTHRNHPPNLWFAHPINTFTTLLPHDSQVPPNIHIPLTADVATLKLTGAHADLWYRSESCLDSHHQMCRIQVYDHQDRKAGTVIIDGATFDSMDFSTNTMFSFLKVSQTTLTYGREDPAWDIETKMYKGRPGEEAVNPRELFDADEEEFDQGVYSPNVCWCLYNVLVVRIEAGVAERIGVGQVHVGAFDGAGVERMRLLLG